MPPIRGVRLAVLSLCARTVGYRFRGGPEGAKTARLARRDAKRAVPSSQHFWPTICKADEHAAAP